MKEIEEVMERESGKKPEDRRPPKPPMGPPPMPMGKPPKKRDEEK